MLHLEILNMLKVHFSFFLLAGFRNKVFFYHFFDNFEEGFFGNFHRGQVNPNQPLFKIIIATGREFEDF